jgi:hypothetical protein
MFKSKATAILSSLSPDEMKEVKSFVNSPIYNKNKNIVKLYEAIKPFYPEFKSAECTMEHVYKKIYEKKQYNNSIMRNLLSEFYKLMEDYLVYKAVKRQPMRDLLLLDNLEKFDKLYLKKLNEVEILLRNSPIFNGSYFFKTWMIGNKIDYYLNRNKQNKIAFDVLTYGEYRIMDLVLSMPEIISDISANKLSFKIDFGSNIFEQFVQYFDFEGFINSLDSKHPEYSMLKFQYNRFIMFIKKFPENTVHAREVLKYLKENHEQFEKSYLSLMLTNIENFFQYNLRLSGNKELSGELFELYKFMLSINPKIYDNCFPIVMFKNILHIALLEKEVDWAEDFVNKYIVYVRDEDKDSLLNFCNAYLAFERKEYEKVFSYSRNVNDYHYSYKEYLKILHMMVFYELNQSEQFFSMSDTFRKFIDNSNLINPFKKISYKFFLKLTNKLMKLKLEDVSPYEITELRNELIEFSKTRFLPYKKWLLEKIDELENKH